MAKNLKNIQAIKQMLEGEHKSQTKLVIPKAERKALEKSRKVGDIWYDDDGNKWEQCDGYKVKHGKLDEIRKELKVFSNCPKEVCTCTNPSKLDLKFKAMQGKCSDCVFKEETQLKIQKKYDDYETKKMLENAKSWLKEAEREVELLKEQYTQELNFVQEKGKLEKWEGMPSKEEFAKNIDNEFKRFKEEYLAKLEKKLEGKDS